MIEIVEREPCPTCGGNKQVRTQTFTGTAGEMGTGNPSIGPCITCHGDGTVPRTLTTFADAAALADAIEEAMCVAAWDPDRRVAVLAALARRHKESSDDEALGVSDDQR